MVKHLLDNHCQAYYETELGAIPPNLLELANTESNSSYMKKCKEKGVKPHPARFPKDFAAFFIKFTTDEQAIVLDPFAGSNTTGFAAEALNRKWISFEINQDYLDGSKFRFETEMNLFKQTPIAYGKT